jgi:hypothetical protein
MKRHSMIYHLIKMKEFARQVIAVRMNQWQKATSPSVKVGQNAIAANEF